MSIELIWKLCCVNLCTIFSRQNRFSFSKSYFFPNFQLDMQLVGQDSVAVLMAAANPHISQQLHYAIGIMKTMSNAPPVQFRSVTVLKYSVPFTPPPAETSSLDVHAIATSQAIVPGCDLKLLIPESTGYNIGFIYSSTSVLCVPCKSKPFVFT